MCTLLIIGYLIITLVSLLIWSKVDSEDSEPFGRFLLAVIPGLNILYMTYNIFTYIGQTEFKLPKLFKKKTMNLGMYEFGDVVIYKGDKYIYLREDILRYGTYYIANQDRTIKVALEEISIETSELTEYVKLLADSNEILQKANKLKAKAKKAKANLFK